MVNLMFVRFQIGKSHGLTKSLQSFINEGEPNGVSKKEYVISPPRNRVSEL